MYIEENGAVFFGEGYLGDFEEVELFPLQMGQPGELQINLALDRIPKSEPSKLFDAINRVSNRFKCYLKLDGGAG